MLTAAAALCSSLLLALACVSLFCCFARPFELTENAELQKTLSHQSAVPVYSCARLHLRTDEQCRRQRG